MAFVADPGSQIRIYYLSIYLVISSNFIVFSTSW